MYLSLGATDVFAIDEELLYPLVVVKEVAEKLGGALPQLLTLI